MTRKPRETVLKPFKGNTRGAVSGKPVSADLKIPGVNSPPLKPSTDKPLFSEHGTVGEERAAQAAGNAAAATLAPVVAASNPKTAFLPEGCRGHNVKPFGANLLILMNAVPPTSKLGILITAEQQQAEQGYAYIAKVIAVGPAAMNFVEGEMNNPINQIVPGDTVALSPYSGQNVPSDEADEDYRIITNNTILGFWPTGDRTEALAKFHKESVKC